MEYDLLVLWADIWGNYELVWLTRKGLSLLGVLDLRI